ncbi:MAG: transcription initiation factor IIB [Candidatus Nitrosocosmicus sp.]
MSHKTDNAFLSIICPLCSNSTNFITDQESTETICIKCGCIVTNYKIQDLGEQFHTLNKDKENSQAGDYDGGKSNESFSTLLALHDNGLYTIIGKTTTDASGQQINNQMKNLMNRLRVWDSRTRIKNNKDRNLLNGLIYLQRLNDELVLSDSVIEKAAYIYRKIQDKGLGKNRKLKVVVTCSCYIACRQMNIPRTLSELAEISNTEEKTLSKIYRDLIFDLDLKIPKIDPMKMIIKIANVCKVSEKTKRYALGLMNEIIKKNLLTSKDPVGLAGTLVYMACKRYDERIVQYEIANASGVTIVTIRKNQKFISGFLKNSL